jgi:hypothetical protein
VFSQAGKVPGDPSQRNIVRDRDVVDQSKSHHEVRRTPLSQRKTFLMRPSKRGARIYEIQHER